MAQNTDAVGNYLFDDLPVGPVGSALCYITEVDITDVDLAACNNLITGAVNGPDLDTNIPSSINNDFGFDENIGLGDFVWYDSNQDGIQDVGEPGVNGITVELFDNATCAGSSIESTTTANGGVPAADGFYDFSGLASGNYCLAFTNLPVGYVISPANQGSNDATDSDADVSTGEIQNINLSADDPSNDMGVSLNGSITGLTWCESSTNPNMAYDVGDGDTLLSNIQVTLYNDANCSDTVDGTDGATAVTQNTNAAGSYLFDDLPVGPVGDALCYITEVDATDVDLAVCNNLMTSPTTEPDLDTNTPNSINNDFGFNAELELGNYVWYDNNQDGIQDVGEPGVNGITVNLHDNSTCSGTAIETTVTTNGGSPINDGYYLFEALAVGDYCVSFTGLPSGYVFTQQSVSDDTLDSDADPVTGQVTSIQLNNSNYSIDAGIYAPIGSVTGLLFCDESPQNGSPDINEEIAGVEVTLMRDFDCDGNGDNVIGNIDTDNTGSFVFENLPVGLNPVPPNPSVCYVMTYNSTAPELTGCQTPITPDIQAVTLTTTEPAASPLVFGVRLGSGVVQVPVNNLGALMVLIFSIMMGSLMYRRR